MRAINLRSFARVSARPIYFAPRLDHDEAIDPNIPRLPTSCIENGDVTPCTWLEVPKISWVITGGHACLLIASCNELSARTSGVNIVYSLHRDAFESWGFPIYNFSAFSTSCKIPNDWFLELTDWEHDSNTITNNKKFLEDCAKQCHILEIFGHCIRKVIEAVCKIARDIR